MSLVKTAAARPHVHLLRLITHVWCKYEPSPACVHCKRGRKQERGKQSRVWSGGQIHTCHHATADSPNHRFGRARENIEFSEVMPGFVDLLVCKKMAHMLVGGGIRPETENLWTGGCCTTVDQRREAAAVAAAAASASPLLTVSDYQGSQRRLHSAVRTSWAVRSLIPGQIIDDEEIVESRRRFFH